MPRNTDRERLNDVTLFGVIISVGPAAVFWTVIPDADIAFWLTAASTLVIVFGLRLAVRMGAKL